MMRTQAFMELLFERAKEAGFEASEIYLSEGESFSAEVFQGEIKSYDVSASLGLGFRGLYRGRMGYASTQVLDEDAAEQLVAGARTNALLVGAEDPEALFAGGVAYPEAGGLHPALERASAADKLKKALALEKAALRLDPRVTQVSDCALFTGQGRLRIANTLGLDASHADDYCGMYLSPIARAGGKTNSAMKFAFAFDLGDLDGEAMARAAVDEAIAGLDGAQVASGGYQVALRNDVAAELLETFAGVFSADAAQKGLSLLKGREGEDIAASCLTLIDDPLRRGGLASAPFDGEGVPGFSKQVIREGRFETLLHNLRTAARQGVKSTGNAARGSYGAKVSVSPSNFYFAPGDVARSELLRRMGEGILVCQVQGLHAGANAVTGDFSLGAKGFLVENGRVGRAVNEITVAGNFFEMLKNVRLLADDLYFGAPSAACVGSPTLWAGELKIAGR